MPAVETSWAGTGNRVHTEGGERGRLGRAVVNGVPGRFVGLDLIGDVHGCAGALVALLERLGYTRRGGVYQYRDQRRPRQVVFLGALKSEERRVGKACCC